MGKIRHLPFIVSILFASGCVTPYWVSPSVNFVPATRVSEPGASVHAYRVDTRETTPYFPGPLLQSHQLTAITVNDNGDMPGQLRVSCTRGFLAFFGALNYITWHQDTVSVRLYRPGFETVELKPWMPVNEIRWRAADTVEDQCKAIDDLVAGNLEPGGIAREHRAALLFAAVEYRRLAATISSRDAHALAEQQRVLEKAEKLEKQASDSFDRGWIERLID